jgi:hypothetical protein
MHLAKQFGASIHAALRRYVECSNNNCALLILENLCKGEEPHCFLRNFIASRKFIQTFGEVLPPHRLGPTWPFVQDYSYGRRYKKEGRTILETKDGPVEFTYQFFNNSYNAFVFLHPIGEVKKSKTTFIVKGI